MNYNENFIHNTIVLTSIIFSWIILVVMLAVVGYLVFCATYITLELPDYLFIIYSLFGCIIMVIQTIICIKSFRDRKLLYNNHMETNSDMRKIIAIVEIDDHKAIKENLGTIDYLNRAFEPLSKSGIFLKEVKVLDDDDKHDAEAISLVNKIFG